MGPGGLLRFAKMTHGESDLAGETLTRIGIMNPLTHPFPESPHLLLNMDQLRTAYSLG